MTEIDIATTSRELRDELLATRIEGARQYEPMRKSIDPEKLFHAVMEFSSEVGIGILAAWLYDKIKEHRPEKTKIQGRDAPHSEAEIRIAIEVIVKTSTHQASDQDQQHKPSHSAPPKPSQ